MNTLFKVTICICAFLVFIVEGQVMFFSTKGNPLDAGSFMIILLTCTFGGMIIGKLTSKAFSKET